MYYRIKGKRVYVVKKGKGPVMILVHGWGGSSKSLERLQDLLSHHYETYSVDLPGFGKSDQPRPTWGVKKYAEVIEQVIKETKGKPVIFFGHSFGGSLGIYLAAHRPSLIDKLIVCAPSYRRERVNSLWTRLVKRNGKVAKFLQKMLRPIRNLMYKVFYPESDLVKHPELESNFRKVMDTDLSETARKIKLPTLILWGELDTYAPFINANLLRTSVKNSYLKTWPEFKHSLPLVAPKLVYNEIVDFLENKINKFTK